jgi:internalin A
MDVQELLHIIKKSVQDKVSVLDLSGKGLKELPSEIGQLIHLNELYLSSNELRTLPSEIGQLVCLNELDISNNQLINLPSEIGNLSCLKKLDLRNNQLTNLNSKIGNLYHLEQLDLRSNNLSSLPPEIGNLVHLKSLYLSYNKLTKIPSEIKRLVVLKELFIRSNQLTEIPPEIGFLRALNYLHLSKNNLTKLPPEIGKLKKLRELHLINNQLEVLPSEIGSLCLYQITLDGNPLPLLPPEIRDQETKITLNFFKQQLEQKVDYLYEAKLLILGESGAGKTTLAKKIQDPTYNLQPDESSTQGIDVIQWRFLLGNGKEFRINIWDFGGQEIYHATHQFFLTKRSLYALVADSRKEDTDFYYWLKTVELLSDNSPLLIIKNEKQERKRNINEQQLRGEFTNLKESLAANFATNRGLPEILTAIEYHIQSLPHVGAELPRTWVEVREALEQDDRSYISLDEYFNICQDSGFTHQEDALQLSKYLHDLGVCLHFQEDDLLTRIIILKPTWGTDAVYKVLDNPQVLENMGKFTHEDLRAIWKEDKYTDMRPELLRLMMNFKLCYEIPNSTGTYIAPQLLTPNQPDYEWNESENLLLRYEYEFMPKGILTRFIVETHPWVENQTCVWKTGVVLHKDGARAEVIEHYRYHKGEICIRVSGKRRRDLLTIVRHELDKIHTSYERLKYSTFIPCNCSSCKGCRNSFKLR